MILLNYSRLAPLGFKYAGMFAPSKKTRGSFIRWSQNGLHCTYICSNRVPQTIGHFTLTPQQKKRYLADKAVLQPPGCCSPSAGTREIITTFRKEHEGAVRSAKHLEEILRQIRHQQNLHDARSNPRRKALRGA